LTMFKATVIACYAALFANDTQRAQELFEEQQMMNIGSEAREARVLDIHRTFLELSVELLCTSTPPRKESVQLLDSFIRQPTPWQPSTFSFHLILKALCFSSSRTVSSFPLHKMLNIQFHICSGATNEAIHHGEGLKSSSTTHPQIPIHYCSLIARAL